jgi:hypothetical protein
MHLRELLVAALWGVVACGSSPRHPPSASEVVLDSLVAGPRIGARAAPVAKMLHLPFAPRVGYADTAFSTPTGVHGLVLWVDETLSSSTDHPTRWAQIAKIGIGFFTRAGADSARRLVTRHLGAPFCHLVGTQNLPIASFFWPESGTKGVLLEVPLQRFEPPYMVFGAQGPDPTHATPRPCDAL